VVKLLFQDEAFHFMNSASLYIEIGQSSLKALLGEDGLELSLDRLESGRLTGPCRERLAAALQGFLRKSRTQRPRAFCAIGARGVSMRRLTLPASSKEEQSRLLEFQIENEFPLPPDELAWGCRPLGNGSAPHNGAGQEFLVVAVKREVIEEYAEILSDCGLDPCFTLGALARNSLGPRTPATYAVLEIGRKHSELITFENSVPSAIRILPWGGEDITSALEKSIEINHDEAEKLKLSLDQSSGANPELGRKIQTVLQTELGALAGLMDQSWIGQRLYLAGKSSRLKGMAPALAQALGEAVECERIELPPGEGRSSAILGLKRSFEKDAGFSPLLLQINKTKKVAGAAETASPWKWAALACLLAIGSLFSLRYAEAILKKPRLARRISEVKSQKEKLPGIDRELGFLQYLETNQPPYLGALTVFANAAAPGTKFDALSMNRRGDISLRATMQNSQATEFRAKLIDSGFFSTVVVDEQTPTPDQQRLVVRITAQWKPAGARPTLAMDAAPGKDAKSEAPPRTKGK
jgi:type IV pilus assembly protein PilM